MRSGYNHHISGGNRGAGSNIRRCDCHLNWISHAVVGAVAMFIQVEVASVLRQPELVSTVHHGGTSLEIVPFRTDLQVTELTGVRYRHHPLH